jgi:cell pole-organizing protein PopZ
VSAQGQQPQPGQAQQAAQQQAQQHDPQALQAAAQFGQALQQHGLQPNVLAGVFGLLQKYGPTLADLAADVRGIFGGGQGAQQQAAQAGQPPGAQAAGS